MYLAYCIFTQNMDETDSSNNGKHYNDPETRLPPRPTQHRWRLPGTLPLVHYVKPTATLFFLLPTTTFFPLCRGTTLGFSAARVSLASKSTDVVNWEWEEERGGRRVFQVIYATLVFPSFPPDTSLHGSAGDMPTILATPSDLAHGPHRWRPRGSGAPVWDSGSPTQHLSQGGSPGGAAGLERKRREGGKAGGVFARSRQ